MKLNIALYLKVDFVGTGWVYKRNGRRNTFGYSRLLVVIVAYKTKCKQQPLDGFKVHIRLSAAMLL